MSLFSRSQDTSRLNAWLAAIDGAAAVFAPNGRLLAANEVWRDGEGAGHPPGLTALDAALSVLDDSAVAFRVSKAVRRAQPLEEMAQGRLVRVSPVDGGALVRIGVPVPVAPAAPAPVAAADPARPVPAGRAGLGALVTAAPVGLARLDSADPLKARVVEANPAFLTIAGGAVGCRIADLVAAADLEDLTGLRIGAASPAEISLAVEPGRVGEGWLLADGDEGSALLVVDVTSRRDMEQRLAQGGKMQAIGQIAGGVAHELNNLLQVITLNADHLLTRHPVGDPSYKELQQIQQTTVRAAELVRMLLAYSRKQTFRRDIMDVGEVLSEFAVLMRQVLDERVRFDIVHGRDLPQVRADKQQLETVLMNLVTNARDAVISAGRGGGEVTVRTRAATSEDVRAALRGKGVSEVPDAHWAMIAVSDTGTGMPPEVAAKIFEPFFTTKEAGKGTGIGMATVYGIVKQSGGFIALETESGTGTTFQVFLPAAAPEETAAAEAAARAAPAPEVRPTDLAGRGRILLVEDEDGVRSIAAHLLSQRGYQVVEACDGEEALEILEANPEGFDLVLSDVVMPGLDGPGLLRAAKPHLGHARVVFMSGYAERDFAQTLEDERSVSFLPKPFTLQQLAERVKSELAAA